MPATFESTCPICAAEIPSTGFRLSCPSCQIGLLEIDSGDFKTWIPRRLGPFHIDRYVAHGGMGMVLEGANTATAEPVALKLLKPEYSSDPSWAALFEREIKAAEKLDHPALVKYYGSGKEGNLRWMAMEWVEGKTLSDLLKEMQQNNVHLAGSPKCSECGREVQRGAKFCGNCGSPREYKFSITQVASYLLPVVEALRCLLNEGIVHRDLKPQNILISQ